jgi:hypothetical protein
MCNFDPKKQFKTWYDLCKNIKVEVQSGPTIVCVDSYVRARDYNIRGSLYYGHDYCYEPTGSAWYSSILTLYNGQIIREIFQHSADYHKNQVELYSTERLKQLPDIELLKYARHRQEYPVEQRIAIFCEPLRCVGRIMQHRICRAVHMAHIKKLN